MSTDKVVKALLDEQCLGEIKDLEILRHASVGKASARLKVKLFIISNF